MYYSFFESISREPLELELHNYNINYVAITPYNFALIRDPSRNFEMWDPMILFKRILLQVIELNATDIHFCVEHDDLEPIYPIYYRRNGDLLPFTMFSLDEGLNKSIIFGLVEKLTSSNSMDLNTPEGITTVANDPLGNNQIELRVSANKVEAGWHCVIRIQQKDTFNFTIDKLGFSTDVQLALHKMTKRRSGIVFITGAIRTGKNTTAFAMANEMMQFPIKIVSYEYPIEVLMPFPQVNYKGDTQILLNSIRLAKKQDLNVAFINELPNKEVAFAVQDLVNSSVYVITTMHVDRLWHLPYKLKDYYGADYKDIISQINGVFNQKMFSVPCKHCQNRKLIGTLDEEKQQLLSNVGVKDYSVSVGCEKCNNTGIQDGKNQPYVEYLLFTPEIKSKLLTCSEPFEMERILQEYAIGRKQSLEFSMGAAVHRGDLDPEALNSIL